MIRSILTQQKLSLKTFQKIARKIQYTSFGVPGGRGLFSPIHQTMKVIPPFIILKPSIKKVLSNWHSIVTQLCTQPTSVLQLVQ